MSHRFIYAYFQTFTLKCLHLLLNIEHVLLNIEHLHGCYSRGTSCRGFTLCFGQQCACRLACIQSSR